MSLKPESGEDQEMSDARTVIGRRTTMSEGGYVLLVIALASDSAEAGVQYASVFGPGTTRVGIESYYNRTGLLLHGGATPGLSMRRAIID